MWVVAVERRDPPLHDSFLPQVGEVARDERDQKRRAGDGPVDARDLRGLDAHLLGDQAAGSVRSLLPDAFRPLQRGIAEALGAEEREALGDVLGVAVGDPRQPAPAGEPAPEAPRRLGRALAVRRVDGGVRGGHPSNLPRP